MTNKYKSRKSFFEFEIIKLYDQSYIRFIKMVASISFFLFLLLVNTTCLIGQQVSDQKRVYKVAIDKEYEPYEFVNEDNKADGFTPNLLREIEKLSNVRFEFMPMTWANAINELEEGRVDLINMIYSPERALLYEFSQPHSQITQALFLTESNKNIQNLASLSGYKIGFQENDISLKNLDHRTDFNKYIFNSKLDGLLQLNLGELDAFFCAQQAGINIITKYKLKNVSIAEGEYFSQKFAFASRKGNRQLVKLLNKMIDTLERNGKLKSLNDQWLTSRLHIPSWIEKNQIILIIIGGFLSLGLILLFGWSSSLQNRVQIKTRSLLANQSLLGKAQEISHLGSWEHDNRTGKLTWSDETYRIFGLSPKEFPATYEAFLATIHPDDRDFVNAAFTNSIAEGKDNYEIEHRIINIKTNEVRFVYEKCEHVKDSSGLVIRSVGMVHDITERKHAEMALLESEERYSTIVECSPNIVFVHKDGVIQYINKIAETILGYSISDSIGKQMLDFVADESKASAIQNIQRRLAGEDVPAYEAKVITKSGEIRTMLTQATFIPYKGEKSFLVILTDITELKQAISKAEESDKLKTAFLQNMSHEIRTPLNGIIGFSGLLQYDDISKEDIKEYTSIIQNSGHRLIEIVNNVLDISKIETGQIEINNSSFSLNTIINDLHKFFSPLANAKDLKLNYFNYFDDLNCIINLDDAKLRQILTNLINNSIKFTHQGTIDFGYKIIDEEIQFYVKDTGSGISKDYAEKIFERFTQANLAITRGYEGAGLGLAICRGLVELMGGRIWVESEPGKGSTFFFNLPYSPSIKTENIVPITPHNQQTHKKVKILIAEDDQSSFDYLTKILRSDKFIIVRAENGKQSIEIIKSTPDIDLILMDIKMPVLNGIEATKQIKQIRPDLPIIAQTAYAFNEEMEEILSIGCDDYIIKPIEKHKLMLLLEKYV